jgi:8-oxo-dGTP diphosphatase
MTRYVLGFWFSPDENTVWLIRKNRPQWQAGKLNGVGGKIENGETPEDAMRREFLEEAGIIVSDWLDYAHMIGTDWSCLVFRAKAISEELFYSVKSQTDEILMPMPVATVINDSRIQPTVIDNLRWLIPLALDQDCKNGVLTITAGYNPVQKLLTSGNIEAENYVHEQS